MNAVLHYVAEGQTSSLALEVALETKTHDHVRVEGLLVRKRASHVQAKWQALRQKHKGARVERNAKQQRRRRYALPVVSAVFKHASEVTNEDLAGFDLGN